MNNIYRLIPMLILCTFILLFVFDIVDLDLVPPLYHNKLKFLFFMHISAFLVAIIFLKYFKIPFLLLVSFFSIINYGAVFCEIPYNMYQLGNLNYEIIDLLCITFFIFYLTSIVSSYLVIKSRKIGTVKLNEGDSGKNILRYVILFLYLLDLVFKINIAGINELLENFVLGAFYYGFLKGKNNTLENIITIFLFVFILIKGFLSGFGYAIIYSMVFVVVVYLSNRNLKLRPMLFLSIILMTAFSFINLISRNKELLRSYDEMSAFSIQDRIEFVLSTDASKQVEVPITSTSIWRASYQISALSLIYDETPSKVPFWNGKSYEVILYKFIPRFIWLNKPREQMGQLFGHTYNITRQSDNTTSMNAPLFVESYMNFSSMGIFLFSLFYGFFISNVFSKINYIEYVNKSFDLNCLDVLVLAQSGLYLIQMESNLSLMIGKLIILLAIRFVLLRFLAVKSN